MEECLRHRRIYSAIYYYPRFTTAMRGGSGSARFATATNCSSAKGRIRGAALRSTHTRISCAIRSAVRRTKKTAKETAGREIPVPGRRGVKMSRVFKRGKNHWIDFNDAHGVRHRKKIG